MCLLSVENIFNQISLQTCYILSYHNNGQYGIFLLAIAEATLLVPYLYIESLQLF